MKENWKFPYTADVLAKAAQSKLEYHKSRLEYWQSLYDKKFAEIKERGLQVQEQYGANNAAYASSSFTNYAQPVIAVDQTLTKEFNDCKNKVWEHKGKIADYGAWSQVLADQGSTTYKLHHQDWMFFFGK